MMRLEIYFDILSVGYKKVLPVKAGQSETILLFNNHGIKYISLKFFDNNMFYGYKFFLVETKFFKGELILYCFTKEINNIFYQMYFKTTF